MLCPALILGAMYTSGLALQGAASLEAMSLLDTRAD
jgi:hypothetical protein